MGYPLEWSHENLDQFLEEIKDENLELIPTMVKDNDLADKADFVPKENFRVFAIAVNPKNEVIHQNIESIGKRFKI